MTKTPIIEQLYANMQRFSVVPTPALTRLRTELQRHIPEAGK